MKDLNINTLEDFLIWAEGLFEQHNVSYGHGTDNPWDEAVAIATHVLKLPADSTRDILVKKLSSNEVERLANIAYERVNTGKPVPYIIKEAWFASERYYIDERAIIPRSPFAELINEQFQPWLSTLTPNRILDLATGSACIAIACSKAFPFAQVDAVDISTDALAVAMINVELHNCKEKVALVHSDLFAELTNEKYDLIVSNPPYVPQEEEKTLPLEYKFEPKLALYSGEDGLKCTKKILSIASDFLTAKGVIFIEVGATWEELEKQYPQIPFTWVEFAYGGEGVLVFTRDELLKYQHYFT